MCLVVNVNSSNVLLNFLKEMLNGRLYDVKNKQTIEMQRMHFIHCVLIADIT